MKLLKFKLIALAALVSSSAFAFSGGEKTKTIQLDVKEGLFEISLDDEQELDQVETIKPFLNITELLKLTVKDEIQVEDSCTVVVCE